MRFDRIRGYAPAVVLVLLVISVYLPGRGGGFVFDDFPNIVGNNALHVTGWDPYSWVRAVFSSNAGLGHRPLAMATFALNRALTGLDPVPMKITNIAIHALNACLVLGLLRALLALAAPASGDLRREWAARFTAAAWALHPINLMAVLFIVQRMESLSHAFVFAGLWLYVAGRDRLLAGKPGCWWRILGGVIGGTALGLMSKESAALLPLYAACLEVFVLHWRNGTDRRDARLLVFFALVLVVPAVLGLVWLIPQVMDPAAFSTRNFDLPQRLLTESRVVLAYLQWTTFPSLRTLGLYHDDIVVSHGLLQPPSTVLAIAAIALLIAAAFLLRKRRPLIALGIAWFLSAHVMTATIIPLELAFEHRNYFASLGVCLAAADFLVLSKQDTLRRTGALLGAIWLALLAMTTGLRAHEWRDPMHFAVSEAAKHPRSPRAAYEYGRALVIASGFRPQSPILPIAIRQLEHDRALPRSGVLPLSALLLTAARTHQPQRDEWWDDMTGRLIRDPIGVQEISAIASLAQCARDGGCDFPIDRMLSIFRSALTHGQNPDVLNIYGDYAFNVMRQPEQALQAWQRASELRPNEAQYRINRIRVLIALQRVEEARAEIAELRHRGRLDSNERTARELEARLPRPD